jgi:glycerol-3-phosphate O-acyltransferase/dihydroxyacetone phosphate acyltransferase
MKRQWVGFFAKLMDSSEYSHIASACCTHFVVPVARAADSAIPGSGRVWISTEDPCLVLGEGTKFLSEFSPRMQIMLPKSVNSVVAEISEVLSDTEMKIKREFGGDSGKGTARIREKLAELKEERTNGLEFKRLAYIDQSEMYRHVYDCLKRGGTIGIFPEGLLRLYTLQQLY